MENILEVKTISELHNLLKYDKPLHPLITRCEFSKIPNSEKLESMMIILGFYVIAFKSGCVCEIKYGRKCYDFQEGSLVFSVPGQTVNVELNENGINGEGWMLCFHPDLIRGTHLGKNIEHYTYFSYSASEALHISQKEKDTINSIISIIEGEYSTNLDIYSNKLIISNLEVLLNYCERFYGRQFITREAANNDIVSKFREILKTRLKEEVLAEKGIPTVIELASEMGYSQYYLSDLLKKETGRTTQEYIQDFILDKAKNLLLGTNSSVAEIAYILGYEYPEHFSKFFKNKVGMSPIKYRNTTG